MARESLVWIIEFQKARKEKTISKPSDWKESITNFLSKNIPDLEAVLLIDHDGNLVHKMISTKFKKNYDNDWLKLFSMIISIRFPMSGFNKQLGGLKITINVFKEKGVLVKLLDSGHILAIIIPWKTNSVISAISVISDEIA